jgi:hypothetical protein
MAKKIQNLDQMITNLNNFIIYLFMNANFELFDINDHIQNWMYHLFIFSSILNSRNIETELNHIFHLNLPIIFFSCKILHKTFIMLNSYNEGNKIDLIYI